MNRETRIETKEWQPQPGLTMRESRVIQTDASKPWPGYVAAGVVGALVATVLMAILARTIN